MAESDPGDGGARRARGSTGEDALADLQAELDRKTERIETLEAELAEAKQFSRLAERFVDALTHRLRAEADAVRGRPAEPALPSSRDPPGNGDRSPGASTSSESDATDQGEPSDGFAAAMDTLADADPPSTEDEDAGGESVFDAFDAFEGSDDGGQAETGGEGQSPTAAQGGGQSGTLRRADADAPAYVQEIVDDLAQLPPRARGMLAHYHTDPPASPVAAHLAAGGDGDRTAAYALNRQLRQAGYLAHVNRGKYRARLRERLAAAADTADRSVIETHSDRLASRLEED